jgi:hypothetical protein
MFPLHFPDRASPCAIRFQLSSTGTDMRDFLLPKILMDLRCTDASLLHRMWVTATCGISTWVQHVFVAVVISSADVASVDGTNVWNRAINASIPILNYILRNDDHNLWCQMIMLWFITLRTTISEKRVPVTSLLSLDNRSGQGEMAGCCEDGNEQSCSIKCWECLTSLRTASCRRMALLHGVS